MSKETAVFVLGFVTFFVPYLGLPLEYKKWILIVVGALLMVIGYTLRRQAFLKSLEHESGERRADVFVESAPKADEKKLSTEEPPVVL